MQYTARTGYSCCIFTLSIAWYMINNYYLEPHIMTWSNKLTSVIYIKKNIYISSIYNQFWQFMYSFPTLEKLTMNIILETTSFTTYKSCMLTRED